MVARRGEPRVRPEMIKNTFSFILLALKSTSLGVSPPDIFFSRMLKKQAIDIETDLQLLFHSKNGINISLFIREVNDDR
jgi:hypothetical protein